MLDRIGSVDPAEWEEVLGAIFKETSGSRHGYDLAMAWSNRVDPMLAGNLPVRWSQLAKRDLTTCDDYCDLLRSDRMIVADHRVHIVRCRALYMSMEGSLALSSRPTYGEYLTLLER